MLEGTEHRPSAASVIPGMPVKICVHAWRSREYRGALSAFGTGIWKTTAATLDIIQINNEACVVYVRSYLLYQTSQEKWCRGFSPSQCYYASPSAQVAELAEQNLTLHLWCSTGDTKVPAQEQCPKGNLFFPMKCSQHDGFIQSPIYSSEFLLAYHS